LVLEIKHYLELHVNADPSGKEVMVPPTAKELAAADRFDASRPDVDLNGDVEEEEEEEMSDEEEEEADAAEAPSPETNPPKKPEARPLRPPPQVGKVPKSLCRGSRSCRKWQPPRCRTDLGAQRGRLSRRLFTVSRRNADKRESTYQEFGKKTFRKG
jgi:hypothetical protein